MQPISIQRTDFKSKCESVKLMSISDNNCK